VITKKRLEALLHEIELSIERNDGNSMGGLYTVRRALKLIRGVGGRCPAMNYRVDVEFLTCHSRDHHTSWTTIYVELTPVGFELMKQRCTSCPGVCGATCKEIDARPVELNQEDEWDLFVKWGHVIVVDADVLRLLRAHQNYPFRPYPLAASMAWALAELPGAITLLFTSVESAIHALGKTKDTFKSWQVEQVRTSLERALNSIRFAFDL